MDWLGVTKRDPVPWLLDPANPSARLLTLRHIFHRPEAELEQERQAVLAWDPICALIKRAAPQGLWGRADNPYFGGPLGTFGTLSTLAQLGVPRFPLAEAACENLLGQGRLDDGRFAPREEGPLTWLCYTGMTLQALCHFGFGEDLRTRSSSQALAHIVLHEPQLLTCKIAGGMCMSGTLKALIGLLSTPIEQRTTEETAAIGTLTEQILAYPFDFTARERGWLQLHFPRYYESDLVELCRVLVCTASLDLPQASSLLQHLIALQTEEGRWIKSGNAPGNIQVEGKGKPSRWLTFEAIHTLMQVYGGNAYAS